MVASRWPCDEWEALSWSCPQSQVAGPDGLTREVP